MALCTGASAATPVRIGSGNIEVNGSGTEKSEIRNVGQFSEVSTSTSIDVRYSQSNKCSVEVSADSNILRYVVTEVNGDRLTIRYKSGITIKRNKIPTVVYVTSPTITKLSSSSAGDIYIDSDIKGDDIKLSASSSGDIKAGSVKIVCNTLTTNSSSSGDITARVKCKTLKVTASSSGDTTIAAIVDNCTASASSSGDVTLKGSCAEKCEISCSSSGDGKLGEFECKNVVARANSGSSIRCWATESIKASASSGASIGYSGNPATCDINKSSGGSVKKL